ncbi:protein indeterminate-domain 9-like [Cucurbita pepo subsp. pepo]|uniref:protein indeterminate-domain 9-like n=1 Tax=Cucurbita pepo subsp. pepo TaxID=3664 RepID=UPI000C9D562E|nr:protein indeterminate-domain 9-like [Cucurbita pepo subsp. pepo]
MFSPTIMANSTPLSDQATIFSNIHHSPQKLKKKRSLPGNPDPDAEVIALSPTTLVATNRFVCEICNKGFQRDQNLQLHRRGHKLPWKLKQRSSKEVKKKAYVCPEEGCVHHNPSRALGDLTGIKKHYSRKHGEKKWKCLKCSKLYAVQSDWKAHSKTCGTREYRCDCGTLFSRKDRFVTHRAFCDALAEESARLSANQLAIASATSGATGVDVNLSSTMVAQSLFPFGNHYQFSNSLIPSSPSSLSLSSSQTLVSLNPWNHPLNPNPNHTLQMIKPEDSNSHHFHQIPNLPLSDDSSNNNNYHPFGLIQDHHHKASSSSSSSSSSMITSPFRNLHVSVQPASNAATSAQLSATALLQKAATVGIGAAKSGHHQPESVGHITHFNIPEFRPSNHISSLSQLGPDYATWQKSDRLTRDFLGLTGHGSGSGSGGAVHVSMIVKDMLTYAGGTEMFKPHNNNNNSNGFGYGEAAANGTWGDC